MHRQFEKTYLSLPCKRFYGSKYTLIRCLSAQGVLSSVPEFLQESCATVGMAKWGMLTAGRNKKQVHGEGNEKEKSQEAGPEARTAEGARRGGRRTGESHGHQQVCWLRST